MDEPNPNGIKGTSGASRVQGASEIASRLGRMEELIRGLEAIADEKAKAMSRELVHSLLALHGEGLSRMLEVAASSPRGGPDLVGQMMTDGVLSNLLILHGLHPVALETRVRGALDAVRPRLSLHGGNVELLEITPEGIVRLRLEGNCHGCPSSRETLKYSIEESLNAAAPDICGIEVEGATPPQQQPRSVGSAVKAGQPKFTECPSAAPVFHGKEQTV